MVVEIIGERHIRTDGCVTVEFIDGKTVVYDGKQTGHLTINPNQIKHISITRE